MSDFTERLKNLNPQQQQAVQTLDGPVLVVAGPGTGKTEMLALRIANILETTDVQASSILCLTFTEAAVLAMRNRLLSIVGQEAYYVRIKTFHSFAGDIIQSHPDKFAFARELTQLSDISRIKILREVLDAIPVEQELQLRPFYNKYQYQQDILSAIQQIKREGVTPEQFAEVVREVQAELENNPQISKRTGKPSAEHLAGLKSAGRNLELAQIYADYQKLLTERGLYDYEDMILFVVGKFGEDDELLAIYQEKFLYILVDEYQDTNGAQNKILQLLGNFDESPNIFVVGDDDQAIYRFQGANVQNLLSFTQQFKDVKTIAVTTNYRSSQLILDAAGAVIGHNQARLTNLLPDLDKTLKAHFPIPPHQLQLVAAVDQTAENMHIVQQVQALHAEGLEYSDIAIIYRRHRDATDIIEALVHSDIPININAGADSLDQPIVRQFVNLLKVIEYEGKQRDWLLFQVLFYDWLKLDRLDVFKLTRSAGDKHQSIRDIMLDAKELAAAGIQNTQQITTFSSQLLDWKTAAANLSLMQFIEQVAQQSGYLNFLFHQANPGGVNIEQVNAFNSFFNYVRLQNRENRDLTLNELLRDLDLLGENKLPVPQARLESAKQALQLMTAHGAKGLEFKAVFIPKFYDGNWGGYTRRESIKLPPLTAPIADIPAQIKTADSDLEDERRLLFVALTRAKERLFISYAKLYPSGNAQKEVTVSQFSSELPTATVAAQQLEHTADVTAWQQQLSPAPAPDYTAAEKEYLQSVIATFRLSATALNEFLECPLKFKYNRLLKVPTVPNKVMALGTAAHFGLEHLLRKVQQGEEATKDYLLFLYEKQLERELLGQDDYQTTLQEGRKLLADYFDYYNGKFPTPVELEYGFYGRHVTLHKSGQQAVLLSGKIDRIDWVDQDHYTVKVVDYKTGSPATRNQILGETKYSEGNIYRQLVFYKLLSEQDPDFRPNKSKDLPKYKVELAEVDFIKPDSKGKYRQEVFQIPDTDVSALKDLIWEVMAEIRALQFGSAAHPRCQNCEYCQLSKP